MMIGRIAKIPHENSPLPAAGEIELFAFIMGAFR
jgi:hypothetical protein